MMKKIRPIITLLLGLFVSSCHLDVAYETKDLLTFTSLVISPTYQQAQVNREYEIRVLDGIPPYQVMIAQGSCSFIPRRYKPNNLLFEASGIELELCVARITDSQGKFTTYQLENVFDSSGDLIPRIDLTPTPTATPTPGSAIIIVPSTVNAVTNEDIYFNVSGGVPPYRITVAGGGSISVSEAPHYVVHLSSRPQTTIFKVTDSAGISEQVQINVYYELSTNNNPVFANVGSTVRFNINGGIGNQTFTHLSGASTIASSANGVVIINVTNTVGDHTLIQVQDEYYHSLILHIYSIPLPLDLSVNPLVTEPGKHELVTIIGGTPPFSASTKILSHDLKIEKVIDRELFLYINSGATEGQGVIEIKDSAGKSLYLNVSIIDTPKLLPNDPLYDLQFPYDDMNIPVAWNYQTDCQSFPVAIVSSGIDVTHPELVNNLWFNGLEIAGTSGVDDDGNGFIDDIYGANMMTLNGTITDDGVAGTYSAGIIGAQGDNWEGIAGVCWNSRLMTLKACSWNVGLQVHECTLADTLSAINYATSMGAKIIDLFPDFSDADDAGGAALSAAISAAGNNEVLIVSGPGQNGLDLNITPSYPCALTLPHNLCIASTTRSKNMISTSDYGPYWIQSSAMGDNMLSTFPTYSTHAKDITYASTCYDSDCEYGVYPKNVGKDLFTGILALTWSRFPHLKAIEVRDRVIEHNLSVGSLKPYIQNGRYIETGKLLE